MANARMQLLKELATIVADYRKGDIQPRTPGVIENWLQQFPDASREPLLKSLVHVLKSTYISRDAFRAFLKGLVLKNKLSPQAKAKKYWRQANYLDIQKGGNSQKEILVMLDEVLKENYGFGLAETGSPDGDWIYLDDCVGTGNRVRADLCEWIESKAPKKVNIHIITPILYSGSWWIDSRVQETAKENGKRITLHKWRLERFDMENRRAKRDSADVLWPTAIPEDSEVQAYAKYLERVGYPPVLRKPGNAGESSIFANDEQKILLEQVFLRRGCQIRGECHNLPDKARPLGYHTLDCLGFGSMFVTYRNCPNNCPLALWVQQAEYPALFPRKTNTQTASEKFVKGLLD